MKLTKSDLIALDQKTKKTTPPRKGKDSKVDWEKVRKEHNGKSAKEIKKATGLSLNMIHKASARGDITLKKYKGIHDWDAINELAKTRTIKQLSKVTGVCEAQLRNAYGRGVLKGFVRIYKK